MRLLPDAPTDPDVRISRFPGARASPARGKSDELTFLSAGAGSARKCQSDHPLGNGIEFHGLAPDPDDPDLS